jgi:hypothetical protein
MQAAARILGLQLQVLNASIERDFDTAFATFRQQRASGLVIGTDAFFNSRSELSPWQPCQPMSGFRGKAAVRQNSETAEFDRPGAVMAEKLA